MANGITNFQIEEANILVMKTQMIILWVLFSQNMNKFIDHAPMISQKRENINLWLHILITLARAGLICGVYLTMSQKHIFFFDSFGVDGLKNFIIQDDKKVIENFFFGTDQMKRTDDKIMLVNIRFNLNACKNLSKK